ncbi:MAG: hypothetical protein RIS29_399, partial [Bacteroidota bacterium]
FVYQNATEHSLSFNGIDLQMEEMDNRHSKYDLSVYVELINNNFQVRIEYATDLYKASTIQQLATEYHALIRNVVGQSFTANIDELINPPKSLTTPSILPGKKPRLDHLSLIELINQKTAESPSKIALYFENRAVSYQELDLQSNKIANYLLSEYQVQPDQPIAVFMERSDELVFTLLGILKAGAAYLPINIILPDERISYMLDDSRSEILLTDTAFLTRVKGLNKAEINISSVQKILQSNTPNYCPRLHIDRNQLAYIIYTSGSTGRPKGVAIEHQSVLNLIEGVYNQTLLHTVESILCLTTYSFDIFVVESWLALCKGVSLIMADKESVQNPEMVASLINTYHIQSSQFTPSRLQWMMLSEEGKKSLASLKVILIGGEPFTPALYTSLKQITEAEIFNMYGPTETTVWSSVCHVKSEKSITIGTPIQNNDFYILNPQNKLCEKGVKGEIAIGGLSLARGYFMNEQLSSERFIYSADVPGERIYLTGDIGEILPNGELQCYGRVDNQVKIHGYRIEIGEIEAIICEYTNIKECAVLPQTVDDRIELIAYFVVNKSDTMIELDDLKKFLLSKLPGYMIPYQFVGIASMPLNNNGKIDKHQLKLSEHAFYQTSRKTEKASETEAAIIKCWQKFFPDKEIQSCDNFFDLGGYSLLALRMINDLNQQFSIELSPAIVFQCPTIRDFAASIEKDICKPKGQSLLIQLKPGEGSPFIMAPGWEGNSLTFMSFVQHFKHPNPVYCLNYDYISAHESEIMTMEETSQAYVSEIEKLFSGSSVMLLGYSFGGKLVFEIAQQLKNINIPVSFMAIVDSISPGIYVPNDNTLDFIKFETTIFRGISLQQKTIYLKNRFWDLLRLYVRIKTKTNKKPITYDNILTGNSVFQKIFFNYYSDKKYDNQFLLIRSEQTNISPFRRLFYLNLMSPVLFWDRNINSSIDTKEFSCGHLDFFKQEHVHQIVNILDQYITHK